jgi:hypothetical protein
MDHIKTVGVFRRKATGEYLISQEDAYMLGSSAGFLWTNNIEGATTYPLCEYEDTIRSLRAHGEITFNNEIEVVVVTFNGYVVGESFTP